MRANPLVCVEVDEVASHEECVSVVVFGRYEELPDAPAQNSEQRLAHQLLQARAMWWEPAALARAARAHRGPAQPFILVFYKIHIDQITGHEATQDSREATSSAVPAPHRPKLGWLRRAWTRVYGGSSRHSGSSS